MENKQGDLEVPVQLMVDDSGQIIYVVQSDEKTGEEKKTQEAAVTEADVNLNEQLVEGGTKNRSNHPDQESSTVKAARDETVGLAFGETPETGVVPVSQTEEDKEETFEAGSSQPITVSEETEVIIDGQRCVLRVNPDSGMLSAYPIKEQPKTLEEKLLTLSEDLSSGSMAEERSVMACNDGVELASDCADLDSSAAQGLLELSNAGPDVRPGDVAERPSGRGRRSKFPSLAGTLGTPIPRFIIPSPGGQTTMMAIMQKKGSQPLGNTGQPSDDVDGAASISPDGKSSTSLISSSSTSSIQIPPSLAPFVLPKKTPVKIGLKTSDEDLAKFKCPKCDFQGFYQKQYQDHIAIHAEFVKKCKCCAHLTFEDDDLLEHYKSLHPKNICSVCDLTAEHAYLIKRHEIRHNSKGCECDICGKVYKDRYILKMHVKLVHMPAEILYACHVCHKKFTRKAHLKRHTRIHEPEKPYKCPHCDYRGCERSDISKHILIHEEPRHACELCGKTFRHIKNKELHVKRHKGQRDYKCGVCDFYGYTFTDIRKHIERKHGEIKTLVCERCTSSFKSEIAFREHRKQCDFMFSEQSFSSHQDNLNLGSAHDAIEIPSSQIETVSVNDQHFSIAGHQLMQVVADDGEIDLEDSHIPTSMAEVTESVTQGHAMPSHHATEALMQDGGIGDVVTLEISHGSEMGADSEMGATSDDPGLAVHDMETISI